MRLRAIACLLSALALLCGLPASTSRADADDAARHCLWKVTGPKGTVYLFGTIHVGSADFYPLPRVIEDSFKQAGTLVEELADGDAEGTAQTKQWVLEHGVYPAPDTVANHLSEQTSAHLAAFLDKFGRQKPVITRLRPWLISMMVTELAAKRLGLDPAHGLDKHFREEATQAHKPIKGLETLASQFALFDALSDRLQDQMLLSSLVEAEKTQSILGELTAAWKSGDADKLQELMNGTVREYPDLKPIMKRLLDDRNDAMTAKVEQFLATPQTYFVAVGAGHLVGERGIVNQLRAKHFAVDQL